MFRFVCLFALAVASCHAKRLIFENASGGDRWIGSLGNDGVPAPNNGSWYMAPGSTYTVDVADDWAGRFWARTGCTFDGNGAGPCATGDCGNKLECNGAGGAPPVTLVEMTFNGAGGQDYYDVSNVDGFNVPASMAPVSQTGSDYSCTRAACDANINDNCPGELQLTGGDGQVVGCKSACLAFNTDQYCCRGDYGTPESCQADQWPVNYAKIFKDACPQAYSYAYDDQKSTFTCTGSGYKITFG